MPTINRRELCNFATLPKALQEKISVNQIKYFFYLYLIFDLKERTKYREFL